MWWLIPAAITAVIVVVAGYAVAKMSRQHDPGYDGLSAAFLMIAAGAIGLSWAAYFVIGALL